MTWIEIVDTAVKVGLGALIGGLTTYFVSKLNHDKEMERDRLRRKRELLEGAAIRCQKFAASVRDYFSLLSDWMDSEDPEESLPDHRKKIGESDQNLYQAFHHLTAGECTLLLVGEKGARAKLREYGEFVQGIYTQLHIDKERVSQESRREMRAKLLEHYESMFEDLSRAYARND